MKCEQIINQEIYIAGAYTMSDVTRKYSDARIKMRNLIVNHIKNNRCFRPRKN